MNRFWIVKILPENKDGYLTDQRICFWHSGSTVASGSVTVEIESGLYHLNLIFSFRLWVWIGSLQIGIRLGVKLEKQYNNNYLMGLTRPWGKEDV